MNSGDRIELGAHSPMTPFPVVIIDDHELFATSLLLALTQHGVAASHTPVDKVTELLSPPAPEPRGLIVLDLDLGVDGNGHPRRGADLVADFRTAGWVVLIVTGGDDDAQIAAAIAHGAVGLVAKSSRFEVLIDAVLAASHARPVMSVTERTRWLSLHEQYQTEVRELAQRLGRLTARERAVLDLLAHGRTAAEIAEHFGVSISTVRSQIRSILAKTQVNSQLAAVALVRPERIRELVEESVTTP